MDLEKIFDFPSSKIFLVINFIMPTIKVVSKSPVAEINSIEESNVGIQDIEVVETNKPVTSKFDIPKHLFTGFTDILRKEQLKFAKLISADFGIDFSEIVEKCLPEQPSIELTKREVQKPVKKSKKSKITDFADAKILEVLKSFKIGELKSILEENDLPISGSKTILMERVWGINHPGEAPNEVRKKRGRPSNTKTPNTVESSSAENVEECELDADKMQTIFVETDGTIKEDSSETTKDYKLFKDKFVFKEGNEEMDFTGIIENDRVNWSEEIPTELLKLLGMED